MEKRIVACEKVLQTQSMEELLPLIREFWDPRAYLSTHRTVTKPARVFQKVCEAKLFFLATQSV